MGLLDGLLRRGSTVETTAGAMGASPPAGSAAPAPRVESGRLPVPDLGALADLPESVRAFVRPCFLPVTEPADFGAHSGFGGAPYLPAGLDHPVCPVCHNPMALFAQLRIDELPAEARPAGAGLLQFFYCTSPDRSQDCDASLGGWEPFTPGAVVRLVAPEGGAPSTVPAEFPPRRIVAWTERPDLPNTDELAEGGVELDDELSERIWKFDMPVVGDKVGGWPAWVQNVEYPSCPRCGSTMRLVLQVDSEDHVPYMWGDVGTGHVTQCPNHEDVLAYAWACS